MSLTITEADILKVYPHLVDLKKIVFPNPTDYATATWTNAINEAIAEVSSEVSKIMTWSEVENQDDYKKATIYKLLSNIMRLQAAKSPNDIYFLRGETFEKLYRTEMSSKKPTKGQIVGKPVMGRHYFIR